MFVCVNCIDEPGLQEFIRSQGEPQDCDYCGTTASTGCISVETDLLFEHMNQCIQLEYDDPANRLPWDGREGGYQGTVLTNSELIYELEIDFPNDHDSNLFDTLVDGLDNGLWCRRDYGVSVTMETQIDWDRFSDVVKHHRRYFFSTFDPIPDPIFGENPPAAMLSTVFDHAESVGLFRKIETGQPIFRARFQEPSQQLNTASQLGPVPRELARRPNRMSPPGIVMFYGAADPETAVKEVERGPGEYAVAEFKTTRPTLMLDLTSLPPVPSLFYPFSDSLGFDPRHATKFLHTLVDLISRRIEPDKEQHVEYVPTQVVSEYVRSQQLYDGASFDGIIYPSSPALGGQSFVLFASQENVLDGLDESGLLVGSNADCWLELVGVQVFEMELARKSVPDQGSNQS